MKLVSIIIPAYNAENYLTQCLTSILNQTYQNIEIKIIDDGSTDRTKLVVKRFQDTYNNIEVKSIENHGQGYARNLLLKQIKGEYVMFVDADDFIEPNTIEEAVNKLEEENSDFVIFDWKYYHHKKNSFIYNHVDKIYKEKILVGKDVLQLLAISSYFSVNKLYKTNFLKQNKIKYLENFIYEDNPFWVKAVVSAKKVSIINKPFYNVRIGTPSSTKSNYETDFHYKSFIKAISETLGYIKQSDYESNDFFDLYTYFLKKFQSYRKNRIPKHLRKVFTKDFLDLMSTTDLNHYNSNKLLKYCYKLNVFKKKKRFTFEFLILLKNEKKYIKKKLTFYTNKFKKLLLKKKKDFKTEPVYINLTKEKENNKKIILFMGFDYRYTGNSRYLFEDLQKSSNKDIHIYFVTNDNNVNPKYRIEPNSTEFKIIFDISDIIIFESWIPLNLKKKPNSLWVQLWHGTPLKKMLFDSDEKEIVKSNKKHKINKYMDIQRWNYLLVDNPNIQTYFCSAFQINSKKIIPLGYPRVKYLLDNKNNTLLKEKIKKKYNIDPGKIIITYMPTWRDYNYQKEKTDFNYILDVKQLEKQLGNNYKIIFKDHIFLNKNEKILDIETQELLLISDYLITDYSSVMFDAFAINLKTIIYCTDFQKYQNSRGVYINIWNDLKDLVVNNIDSTYQKIKNYNSIDTIEFLKDKYSYKNIYGKDLSSMLINYFDNNYYNPFFKRTIILVDKDTDYSKAEKAIEKEIQEGFQVIIGITDNSSMFIWNNHKKIFHTLNIDSKSKLTDTIHLYQPYNVINLSKTKY